MCQGQPLIAQPVKGATQSPLFVLIKQMTKKKNRWCVQGGIVKYRWLPLILINGVVHCFQTSVFAPPKTAIFFMQALKDDITKMAGEHPEHLEYVLSKFVQQKLKRGEYLFVAGQVCRSVYFVQSGLLQVLYVNSDGVEKTADIVTGNNWFSDIDSFKNGIPSQVSARAVKSTVLYKINRETFQALMQKVPKFAEVYLTIIEGKYKESSSRITAINGLNSTERIAWLRKNKPEFLLQVSDKLIASYLGISKETYCRQKQVRKTVENCQ